MSIIQTTSKSVAQFASGLFGYALGAPTSNAVLAEAGLTGVNTIFNTYYTQTFSALSAENVARLLVSNVGVVAGQNGITSAIVTEAVTYVKNQLTAAAATGTQGQVAASLLIGFSNMTADPVFGAAARAWNTQVDRDMAYTASGATTDVPVALAIVPTVAAPTYTITADHSSVTEGQGVTYTVTTTGVEPGTSLAFMVSGTGNALASTAAGVVTINTEGKGTIAVPTFDNAVANDNGVLSFKLISGNQTLVSAADVTVNTNDDTVVPPTIHTLHPAVDTIVGAKQFTVSGAVTEGDTVTFTVHTTDIAMGTKLPFAIAGTHNAAASATSGFLEVGSDGTATVAVSTAQNSAVGDAGVLTMTVSYINDHGLNTQATGNVNVADNDTPPVPVADNVRDLTTGSDAGLHFDLHTHTDDVQFNATVGYYDSETTLTTGDKLKGGSGSDTLYVTVSSDDASFRTFDTNGHALTSIENVVIDTTDHDILDSGSYNADVTGGSYTGIFALQNDVSALDASYFDVDGSLEKITIKDMANNEAMANEFNNVYLHKNMTLGFEGSGVADEAGDLDEDVLLARDVTDITVDLSGVGGSDWSTLWFSQDDGEDYDPTANGGSGDWVSDDQVDLSHLTVVGTLSHTQLGYMGSVLNGEDDAGLNITGSDYQSGSNDFQHITPETITISLEKTADVSNIAVEFDDDFVTLGDVSVLRDVSLLDFSASTANIDTFLFGPSFNDGSDDPEASTLTIKDGLGDDSIGLFIVDMGRTAVTIDLGASSTDNNAVVLTNYVGGGGPSGGIGNVALDDIISTRFSDQDLTEDLISIDNFDLAHDQLYMPTVIAAGEDNSGGGDYGYGYSFAGEEGAFVLRTEQEFTDVATAAARAATTGNKFFAAVDAVATHLLWQADHDPAFGITTGDLLNNYAAAFEYEGSMYIYIDANRIYDETFDWTSFTNDASTNDPSLESLGLSNGDVLIKLSGVTSVHDLVLDGGLPYSPI